MRAHTQAGRRGLARGLDTREVEEEGDEEVVHGENLRRARAMNGFMRARTLAFASGARIRAVHCGARLRELSWRGYSAGAAPRLPPRGGSCLGLRAVRPEQRAEGEQAGPHHRAAYALAPLPWQPAAAAAEAQPPRRRSSGGRVEGEPIIPSDDGEKV